MADIDLHTPFPAPQQQQPESLVGVGESNRAGVGETGGILLLQLLLSLSNRLWYDLLMQYLSQKMDMVNEFCLMKYQFESAAVKEC